MNNKFIITFILVFIVPSLKTVAQSKYDIFPLLKNLKYSYSFYQQSDFRDLGYPTILVSDSGKVEYIICDSIKSGDTVIIWDVEQRQDLVHKEYFGQSDSSGSSYLLDTVYSVIDTINFPLYEYLTTNHELKGSSLIWNFPLIVWPNSYFLPNLDSSMYRYSDSMKVLYVFSKSASDVGWNDSIWFSNEDGMYQRVTNSYSIHIGQWYYTLRVNQINRPTEIDQINVNRIYPFTLFQNYPNPFNPSTTIKYSLSRSMEIKIELFDCVGKKILDLDKGFRQSGDHRVELKLDNLPSGIYFYRLNTENYSSTRKLVLLK